jgi:hypothetical protein
VFQGGGAATAGGGAPRSGAGAAPPSGAAAKPAPAAKPAAASGAGSKATAVHTPAADEQEGVCQFCGGCGPRATEAQLDLHYWQACPMLTACPRCQQIVEIATLQVCVCVCVCACVSACVCD